jgi:hypothetical protein
LLGRDEIADQRARRRPAQLRGRAREERARDDRGIAARLREREHCRARREHRQRDGVAAAEAIGEMSAENRRHDVAAAVRADGDARLRDRVSAARQVDRQHRHDERAETVDERAGEEHPRRARQGDSARTIAVRCPMPLRSRPPSLHERSCETCPPIHKLLPGLWSPDLADLGPPPNPASAFCGALNFRFSTAASFDGSSNTA